MSRRIQDGRAASSAAPAPESTAAGKAAISAAFVVAAGDSVLTVLL
jgi:hypothetical protein